MSLTYKEDQSFFTTIIPPFAYYGFSIKRWLTTNNVAKFRYIRDIEMEREFCNLKQVIDMYPGTKTIGLVLNPWARIAYGYNSLLSMKNDGNTYNLNIDSFKLDSFEDFVNSINDNTLVDPFWFKLSTPQLEWFNHEGTTVDYLIRAEHLEEDFKPIQEYFCSFEPLTISSTVPEYKSMYNETTKAIVAEAFEKDIEKFDYAF